MEQKSAHKQPAIREVVAVFDNAEQLETAVSTLESNGFDRADISFAHATETGTPLVDADRRADDPATPRTPGVSDTDLRQARVLGTSMAATVAAFAAAGFTVLTGGAAAAPLAALAVAGGMGAAGTLLGRRISAERQSFLDAELSRGGVLLWVRTPDAEAEKRAIEMLQRHAFHVHGHETAA